MKVKLERRLTYHFYFLDEERPHEAETSMMTYFCFSFLILF